MGKIQELVDSMDPQAAAAEIAEVVKRLFSFLGEEVRLDFVMSVIGDARKDKVGGLVHL